MIIGGAKSLYLGKKVANPRFITLELDRGIDLNTEITNLVCACDWFNGELASEINGRFLEFDISQVIQQGGMEAIQSVYIDNGPNTTAFTVEVPGTKQRVTCPPNSQGWFPLICNSKDGKFRLGAIDIFNNNGFFEGSWEINASVNGGSNPVAVRYKPTFIFTDLAVPPAVWDCRIPMSNLIGASDILLTLDPTPISSGLGNRIKGFGVRIDETAPGGVELIYGSTASFPTIFGFWFLAPGENFRLDGEYCSTNIIYLEADVVDTFYQTYTLI